MVPGSCSLRICFKQLEPFKVIAQNLKERYHSAIVASATNNIPKRSTGTYTEELVYSETSPNFCLGDGTRGRRCLNVQNCATLCCTRGYLTEKGKVMKRCNEKWNETIINVTYSICEKDEIFLSCR